MPPLPKVRPLVVCIGIAGTTCNTADIALAPCAGHARHQAWGTADDLLMLWRHDPEWQFCGHAPGKLSQSIFVNVLQLTGKQNGLSLPEAAQPTPCLQVAARANGRSITILRMAGAAADHTLDPAYPEGAYLTNVLLRVL